MNISTKKIGLAIKRARLHEGLTQHELANHSNISRNYISKIELGTQDIGILTFISIAKGLGWHPTELMDACYAT